MRKKYSEPEFELTQFSFERMMGNYAVNSDLEDSISAYENDPLDPDPGFS